MVGGVGKVADGTARAKAKKPGILGTLPMPPRLRRATVPPNPPPAARRTTRLLAAATGAYLLLLVVATHVPKPEDLLGDLPRTSDKLLHLLAYAVLAALAAATLASAGRWQTAPITRLALALAAFGIVDEITQPLCGRTAEPLDWVADCLGIACGIAVVGALVSSLVRLRPRDVAIGVMLLSIEPLAAAPCRFDDALRRAIVRQEDAATVRELMLAIERRPEHAARPTGRLWNVGSGCGLCHAATPADPALETLVRGVLPPDVVPPVPEGPGPETIRREWTHADAADIATLPQVPLVLTGATSGSDDLLAAAAARAAPLVLADVTSLTPRQIDLLAAGSAPLVLTAMETLDSPELATVLGRRAAAAGIFLPRVRSMSVAAAEALAAAARRPSRGLPPPMLSLPSLTELPRDVAAALAAEDPGWQISLPALAAPAADAVRQLVAGCRAIDLGAIRLDEPLARALGDPRRRVTKFGLPFLQTADPAAVAALVAAFAPRIRDRGECTLVIGGSVTGLSPWTWEPAGPVWTLATQGGSDGLPADVAAALAAFPGTLHVVGLRRLDATMLESLAPFPGRLFLSGPACESLDAATEEALARIRGQLVVATDHVATAALAEKLARQPTIHPGDTLGTLATLGPEAAAGLATLDVDVALGGLETLDAPPLARKLAQQRDPGLVGLRRLSVAAARALATRSGDLQLPALDGFTGPDATAVAAALARKPGLLSLPGIHHLDVDVAEALAAHRGPLWLPGLEHVDDEVARALARHDGPLDLSGLVTLESPTLAAKLAADAGGAGLTLRRLKAFTGRESVAVAAALARTRGELALPGLVCISPQTLTALVAKQDVKIPPLESLWLIDEPDGGFADDFVIPRGRGKERQ